MQAARYSDGAPRARSAHPWTFLALLGLAMGCGDGRVTAPPPDAPQPQASTVDLLEGMGLETLPGPVPTFYSPGYRERAEALQAWLRDADVFFQRNLRIEAPFHLAVLAPADWAAVTGRPGPYGVPQFTQAPRVVLMPAVPEASVVTQIYTASQVALPPAAAARLAALGVSYDDAVLQVLDLIGFHEVGHVYIAELGYDLPNTARWFVELLATYAAYSYLDVKQPASIIVWDALSEAVLGFVQPTTRSLDDFNQLYAGGLGPAVYGWFQSQFNLRDTQIVKQRPRATWFAQLAAQGFDDGYTLTIPTSELLQQLRGFMPSFTKWAESAGLEYE